MPIPALKVEIDVAGQVRVKASRIAVTVAGEEWDGPTFSETYLVPRINTLICRPAPLRPEWHSSNSGPNARWSLSDFGLTAGNGWTLHGTKQDVGPVRMYNPKGMAAPAKLGTALTANRSVFVSFFCFNVGNENAAVYFECGYSDTGTGDHGPSLRFWSGGTVDVYKDGGFLATYTLGNRTGTQVANQYQDVILLPMRGRELTVVSVTGGDSFTHVFLDIPEDAEDPEVTPAERFWWYVPAEPGATRRPTVDVEAAPVWFHDGFATSLECALGRAPKAGASLETWENDAPFDAIANGRIFATAFPQGGTVDSLSVVGLDGTTPFVPDGSATACRLRVEMTGGTHTAFVDAAHLAYEAETAETQAGEEGPFDLTPYVREAELTVPDSGDPAEVSVTLGWPEELDGLVPKLLTVGNRPARVTVGDGLILDGVTLPPKFADGEHDGVRTATVAIRDRMHSLAQAQIRDRVPLDGLPLCKPAGGGGAYGSAVEFWYRHVGVSEVELDLDDVDHRLPRVPSADAKEFCCQCDVGAHPLDELRQLQQDQAASFLWGVRPTAAGARYLFKDPDGFPSEPDKVLYRSDEEAEAADADPDEDVYWTYREEPLEIEANEVRASGWDPRLRRAITSYREDLASKDPALAPADRPDNWLGEERVMGVVNRRLARQADCDRVVEYVFPQVSARYWVGEWSCSMLFLDDGAPVWRGHLVQLDGRRALRVSSLRVRFWREPGDVEADAVAFREATYTGGTLTNAGGIGLDAIRAAHARRAVNKTVRREGAGLIEQATARMVAIAAA